MPVLRAKSAARLDFAHLVHDEKYKNLPYLTLYEVMDKQRPRCCWVILFDLVRDVTPLVRQYRAKPEAETLLEYGGDDISHWFNASTGDIKTMLDLQTGRRVPVENIPHSEPDQPSSKWKALETVPWWKDDRYIIGKLSAKDVFLHIANMCTNRLTDLIVAYEESVACIAERYAKLEYNRHRQRQYVWKCNGNVLDMEKTLEQNGLDQNALFMTVPCIWIDFKPELQ
uniref:Cytochrome b5 domain-containing protein 1 n=1 Tax=Cacopsylla melanoneura TaxID=428564 RepID=A0A8D8YZY8_9HEMI